MTETRKIARALGAALLLAALLLFVAWAVFSAVVREPPAAPRTVAATAVPTLTVAALTAPVERSVRGGDWSPLEPGAELHVDEEIRTGQGGSAELNAGDRGRVVVSERSQLSVRELTDVLHRYGLARGRVLVDYPEAGNRVVRVEGGGDAVAEARGARFHVAANGVVFAVATETGRVDLRASGESVSVEPGFQAAVRDGGPPSAPHPIPREVLLKLAATGRVGPGAGCLDATGRADPAAIVTVDGIPVVVDERGGFPIRVDRRGGAPVEVVATLPDGRIVSRRVPCAAEPEVRIRDIEVRWRREP